jgi:cell division protein ZapE
VRAAYERWPRAATRRPAQLRAVEALQRCADEWAAYKASAPTLKKLINHPDIPRASTCTAGWGAARAF